MDPKATIALLYQAGIDNDGDAALEALENLCDWLAKGGFFPEYEDGSEDLCDAFDAIAAAYWACTDCHGGMHSNEYRMLSILGRFYSPGGAEGEPETEAAIDIYETLCEAML